jgi:hypothetical protein
MDTNTIGAENTLPQQQAAGKTGRPPQTRMASATNQVRLQRDLDEEYEF